MEEQLKFQFWIWLQWGFFVELLASHYLWSLCSAGKLVEELGRPVPSVDQS